MKRYVSVVIAFFCVAFLFFSCASSEMKAEKIKAESDPEIGEASMSGGERVAIKGYSGDSEMNKKMKLMDLEVIDCYKQYTAIGKNADELNINFTVIVDETGFIEKVSFKGNGSYSNKIAACVANDMQELSFRPGDVREINYKLVFKPIKQKKKENSNNPRSKMILSLSEMKKFRVCYEEQIANTPGVGGNFTIKFIVTEDGRAEDIKISGNSFSDAKVPLCVVKKLSDTIFPEGESEDRVEVNFKFVSSSPVKQRRSMDIDM